MTVLLATDDVVCFSPSQETDEHGWRLPGLSEPYWSGRGSLQLHAGASDPRAESGGGHGPYAPAVERGGTLYLPGEIPTVPEGAIVEVRGQLWVLSQVRRVIDPVGGGLDCWTATATGVEENGDGS